MIANYTRVKLITDKYQEKGAKRGDIGYVIEIYGDDAYEIEFSDREGITFAQIVAHRNEIEPCEPHGSTRTQILL